VVLAPLIVVSCFTVETAPHDGHGGGGVDLIVLSGIPSGDPIIGYSAVRTCAGRLIAVTNGE